MMTASYVTASTMSTASIYVLGRRSMASAGGSENGVDSRASATAAEGVFVKPSVARAWIRGLAFRSPTEDGGSASVGTAWLCSPRPGRISLKSIAGVTLAHELDVDVESDGEQGYIATSSLFPIFGVGSSQSEALDDFSAQLIELRSELQEDVPLSPRWEDTATKLERLLSQGE